MDDAQIDNAELIVTAMRELEAVHIQALERLYQVRSKHPGELAEQAEAVRGEVREVMRRVPSPVRAALIRAGVVDQYVPTYVGSSKSEIEGPSEFGVMLLEELRPLAEDPGDNLTADA